MIAHFKVFKETLLTLLVSASTITLNYFAIVNAILGTVIACGSIFLLYFQIRKAMFEKRSRERDKGV